jgi:hypothetical protein
MYTKKFMALNDRSYQVGSLTLKAKCSSIRLSFGNKELITKFTVVDDIFPRVIVGIRSMKGFGLILEPQNDLARIGNFTLPFLSKTIAPSVSYESGKEKRSVSRVRNGLKEF